jgi:flavin reductase (DIM6/NTAB) family NADH-FMN oxidoreductase RutF
MAEDKIKAALNLLPYGFYAIGSRHGDERNLMVANWLTQASFTPRQVAFALSKTAHTHEVISAGGVFAVSIFHKDDADLIKQYTKSRAKDPDKVRNYTDGPETGCPIVEGAAAYLECKVVGTLDSGGDHDIIVGEVVGAGVHKEFDVNDTLGLPDIGWSYAG